MPVRPLVGALAALLLLTPPAFARNAVEVRDLAEPGSDAAQPLPLPPYLQCVPYARAVSGIPIYGDAYTWWEQAEGRHARGSTPKAGAVMAFKPHGNMELGHVAAVSQVIDSRTVLLRHANWSPINGRRGQIEDNVRAIDVSEENDWSEVRVWYAPIEGLGATHWPVHGFIYKDTPGKAGKTPKTKTRPASTSRDPIGDIIAASLD